MKSVVTIIGMHRSGTSMVANWLFACGLNIGERLLKGDFSNKRGHFEDVDFLSLHKSILRQMGTDESGLKIASRPQLSSEQIGSLADLVRIKSNAAGQWAWKDPRTCLFLSYYRKLIPELKSIVILRDYSTSIQSLLKRDINRIRESQFIGFAGSIRWWFKKSKIINSTISDNYEHYRRATKIYLESILEHLNESEKEDLLVLDANTLLSHDEEVIDHLLTRWGFTLAYVPFDSVYDRRIGKNLLDISQRIPEDDDLKRLQERLEQYKYVGED